MSRFGPIKTGAVTLVAALAATTFASPAAASDIVHLRCDLKDDSGFVHKWTLALDESTKTISYRVNTYSGTVIGIFSADDVTWDGSRNRISRIDLTMTRRITSTQTQAGQCTIVEVPKRAF